MKKNKVFANKINGEINNNQKMCEVERNEKTIKKDKLTVEEKLDKLFNTNGYIFNINVQIITDLKTYYTKIVSCIGNNIITIDNDVINIDDIKDIIY